MTAGRAGGRKKLEPDPQVRSALLSAASKVVREEGVRALSASLGAQPGRVGYPGVLPALRLQGPTRIGPLSRDGTTSRWCGFGSGWRRRSDPVACGGGVDRRAPGPGLQRGDPFGSAPDVARGADPDVRGARDRRARLPRDPAPARRRARRAEGIWACSRTSIPTARHCRFRVSCGPTSNGTGRPRVLT